MKSEVVQQSICLKGLYINTSFKTILSKPVITLPLLDNISRLHDFLSNKITLQFFEVNTQVINYNGYVYDLII